MNNLPPPVHYFEFIERIRCLCALHDASVTSGPRTVYRNRHVGGHVQSRHLVSRGGMATDLVLDDMSDAARSALVDDAIALGLLPLDEADHVHIQGSRPGTTNPGDPYLHT